MCGTHTTQSCAWHTTLSHLCTHTCVCTCLGRSTRWPRQTLPALHQHTAGNRVLARMPYTHLTHTPTTSSHVMAQMPYTHFTHILHTHTPGSHVMARTPHIHFTHAHTHIIPAHIPARAVTQHAEATPNVLPPHRAGTSRPQLPRAMCSPQDKMGDSTFPLCAPDAFTTSCMSLQSYRVTTPPLTTMVASAPPSRAPHGTPKEQVRPGLVFIHFSAYFICYKHTIL